MVSDRDPEQLAVGYRGRRAPPQERARERDAEEKRQSRAGDAANAGEVPRGHSLLTGAKMATDSTLHIHMIT